MEQGEQVAIVQIILELNEIHVSFVKDVLAALGLEIGSWEHGRPPQLTLRRTLVRVPGAKDRGKTRLKSLCQINGTTVTLKTLCTLTSPLLVVVDASVAAAALARPETRLAMLDTAIDPTIRQTYQSTQQTYRQCRMERERIEEELENRILPQSFSMDTEEDVELMNHWIEEIEAYISRVDDFIGSLSTEEGDNGSLNDLMSKLQGTDWTANAADSGKPFASAFYEIIRNFRDAVRSLDNQIMAASNAATVLSSLSVVESAATALKRARSLLYDASGGDSTFDRLEESSEMSHDLLNQAEEALTKCARFIEDHESGLFVTLETMRGCCPVSVDNIDSLILDWNSLARKHGISPLSLPSCYKSLIHERDGNVKALAQMPLAESSEKRALVAFVAACDQLSLGRQSIAESLQEAVNSRLPSLGMTTSEFGLRLNRDARQCTDPSVMSGSLGVDSVEFFLHHGRPTAREKSASERVRGGMLHEIASSGEKARILLAIECSLPGSVRTATVSSVDAILSPPPVPVAVVYDEIDAHVGGHAAVALGHMLADQSRQTQVMAITHSPAVAATADAHVVVEKTVAGDKTVVYVRRLDESERRKELARMASGDVAMDEAEIFAQALIRDGLERRKQRED
jgi:DNA repair ATPase RecN